MHHFPLTVCDVLKRKHFGHVEIIAGNRGLNRTVKWVHILEVTDIKSLLKGNELILSTGLGWREDESLFTSFLEELIEIQAAALCIDMTRQPFSISPRIISLANEHHFPVLLFQEEVPYVEITQDIHSYLINKQYQMIRDLECYSQILNKKLLSVRSYEEIVELLHEHTGHAVLFQMEETEILFPTGACIKPNTQRTLQQCIRLFGQDYAQLYLFGNRDVTEYDNLMLDRTATAIAQFLLRDLFVAEKRRVEESEWVHSWLAGEYEEREIDDILCSHRIVATKGGTVCVSKFQGADADFTYYKLLFRTIFEQFGFFSLCTEKRNELSVILLNQREGKVKQRLEQALERLLQTDFMRKQKYAVFVGVGKFVEFLDEFPKALRTAKETIKIQQVMQSDCRFYEDMHMYRLLSMYKHEDLQEIVMEYLEPVIWYDQKYKGKLIETLRVYLACHGSKQETAKKLFVVRQTLYHRITKLEQLLGEDFMKPNKRLVIEFMLQAYDYLLTTKRMKTYEKSL
jgi:purine catabolism regulator